MKKTTGQSGLLPVLLGPLVLAIASLGAAAVAGLAISSHAPHIAGLSGERGDQVSTQREISRGKAATALTLISRDDIACGIALEGRKLGVNANFETERLDRCSSGKGRVSEETADVWIREHIVGVRVCTSLTEPVAIAGFEIAGVEVDEDGLSKRSPRTERRTGQHCDRWRDWSSCPDHFVVTGFVARFSRRERDSNSPDALVGLEAVCREVDVQ